MWKPVLLALFAAGPLPATGSPQDGSAPPSPGTWSGGFGSIGPDRVDYELAIVELSVAGERLVGELEGNGGAAVEALRARDDVDAERIGLIGGSQAGWVIPQAAAPSGAAFAIVISGGTTAFDYENVFSRWSSEGESDASNPSIDELYERLRKHEPRDRFRREWFASIPCPGLRLFGAIDRSNPSLLCAERIEEVRAAEGLDFEVVLFPTGNHSLNDAVLGGPRENLVLRRSVPDLYQTVADWLDRKGLRAP